MSIDINLVNKSTSEGSKDLRLKKIKTISFVTLFFVAFLSLIIFLINFRFSVNYVKNQQTNLIKELSIYDETVARMLLLNNRLADVSTLLSQRKKYDEVARKILENPPESIVVEGFEIGAGGILIDVSSDSLLDLNSFLNHALDLSKKKVINAVILDSLSTEKSSYLMKFKAD